MDYEALEALDEQLNEEIFNILYNNKINNLKKFKKLNFKLNLKIKNNIIKILEIHDELEDVKSNKDFNEVILGFIQAYNAFKN